MTAQIAEISAEVSGAIDKNIVPFKSYVRILPRELQDHPGKFAIGQEDVAAAAEEAMRHARLFQQMNQFRQRFVLVNYEEVGRAANLERSFRSKRYTHPVFNAQGANRRNQLSIVNPHISPRH